MLDQIVETLDTFNVTPARVDNQRRKGEGASGRRTDSLLTKPGKAHANFICLRYARLATLRYEYVNAICLGVRFVCLFLHSMHAAI